MRFIDPRIDTPGVRERLGEISPLILNALVIDGDEFSHVFRICGIKAHRNRHFNDLGRDPIASTCSWSVIEFVFTGQLTSVFFNCGGRSLARDVPRDVVRELQAC